MKDGWSAETLTRLLAELARLGEVRLGKDGEGLWHASCKFPSPKGVTAEVRSDFKHTSPIEALQCVHDRLGGLRSMVSMTVPQPGLTHMEIVK